MERQCFWDLLDLPMVLARVEFCHLSFFSRYIRDMLHELVEADAGCNIGGVFINVLAYADDLVLYAPTWQALQYLINILACHGRVPFVFP